MVVVWVFLGIAALAVEAAISAAFFAFFLAIGFGAGALADTFGLPVWLQLLLVAAVALTGMLFVRPLLVGQIGGLSTPAAAGSNDLVGQRALTVDEVGDEHHPGHALLAGERWLAVSAAAEPIPADIPVLVAAVRGTTLLVLPAPGAPSKLISS
jgi:membrane protein implicated in regulation of membrane protease activity